MKYLPSLLFLALVAIGSAVRIADAQTTNSAPSGITVTQGAAQTVTTTVYTPAVIVANPTHTSTLTSSYLSPLFTAAGVTVPSGAVTRTFTVTYYNDGSSRSVTTFCASGALPAPPVALSTNSN